jgi:hypothetical protein
VANNFADGWWQIMATQSQFALKPEHQRQRAGDKQQVVELTVQKTGMKMRLEKPPVQHIKRATQHEQRISPVAEPFHSAVIIIAPASSAITSLAIRIMLHSNQGNRAEESITSEQN